MLITRIYVKILHKDEKIVVLCSCNTKKNKSNNIILTKRSNNESCKFRINYKLNDGFYNFIDLKLHNHGPELSEFVSFK